MAGFFSQRATTRSRTKEELSSIAVQELKYNAARCVRFPTFEFRRRSAANDSSLELNGSRAKYVGEASPPEEKIAMAGNARKIRAALIAIASVTSASVLGQIATYPNLQSWYAGLIKPSFNPPNWIFAPVWTTLFVLMGFAFWRILRLPNSAARDRAVWVFALMLVLNAAWSWMFFAAHSPVLGLVNIVPQLATIGASIVLFGRLDRLAAACLAPLFAWVTFATLLNFSIFQLNG